MPADTPLLEVRDLSVEYATGDRPALAVDKVSFKLGAGQFLGVAGESGCGKSTMLFAIACLLRPPAELVGGQVLFRGKDLTKLDERQLRPIRWKGFSVVMQSAMNALNPVKTVGAQFVDVMRAHGVTGREEIEQRSAEAMRLVGIDAVHLKSFPHQLSGGMRQRTMIAMALLFSPELVVMDEPTSALDVVAQRSLMQQIRELQQQLGFATIFVTHDMSLLTMYSDLLAVMYAGQIVEFGPTERVFAHPSHPYARGLFEAFPSVYGERRVLTGIHGSPPDLSALPEGCNFYPRCPSALSECAHGDPPVFSVDGTDVRCVLFAPSRAGHA